MRVIPAAETTPPPPEYSDVIKNNTAVVVTTNNPQIHYRTKHWKIGIMLLCCFGFLKEFHFDYFISACTKKIDSESIGFPFSLFLLILMFYLVQIIFGLLADYNTNTIRILIFVSISIGMLSFIFSILVHETGLVFGKVMFVIFYSGIDPLALREIFRISKPERRSKAISYYIMAKFIAIISLAILSSNNKEDTCFKTGNAFGFEMRDSLRPRTDYSACTTGIDSTPVACTFIFLLIPICIYTRALKQPTLVEAKAGQARWRVWWTRRPGGG